MNQGNYEDFESVRDIKVIYDSEWFLGLKRISDGF